MGIVRTLSLVALVCNTGVSIAAAPNGELPIGTVVMFGQTLQVGDNSIRACFSEPQAVSPLSGRGDGGTKLQLLLPVMSVRQTTNPPNYSVSQASFAGAALLVLDNAGGTTGTLTFLARGQGSENGQSRSYGAKFLVSSYVIKVVDNNTVQVNFVVNLNTFGSCKMNVTGLIAASY